MIGDDIMSDMAAALATGNLPPYRDGDRPPRDVIRSSIQCRGFAAGFKSTLAMAPRAIYDGDEVTIVIRARCLYAYHKAIPDSDIGGEPAMERIQVLAPVDESAGLLIDDEAVASLYKQAEDNARRLQEEAAGISRLPLAEPDDDEWDDAE